MKKLFLSLVVAIVAATATYAQSTLVATLSHGSDITMFYGSNALRNAHNAAVSGDVINLSGGAFQAVNITKAITLRGAGIDAASPSYITGDFTINIPTDDANRLTLEGLRCSGTINMKGTFNNPYFVKSQLNAINYYNEAVIKNAFFGNCKITGSFELCGTSTAQFINSFVNGFQNSDQTNTSATFANCVILPYDLGNWTYYIERCQMLNCIIYQVANKNYNIQVSHVRPKA